VIAAWRDASWFRSPGVARRYHVLDDDRLAKCGLPGFLLSDDTLPARMVAPELRCQRNGCKQTWPKKEENDG
jgi:hypothetical protein